MNLNLSHDDINNATIVYLAPSTFLGLLDLRIKKSSECEKSGQYREITLGPFSFYLNHIILAQHGSLKFHMNRYN